MVLPRRDAPDESLAHVGKAASVPHQPTHLNSDDPDTGPGRETARRDLTARLDHLRAARLHDTQPPPAHPNQRRMRNPKDNDNVAPPTDDEIEALLKTEHDDPDTETDTIDTLQSFWADERRLNANRIWHTIDDQLDETPQTSDAWTAFAGAPSPKAAP